VENSKGSAAHSDEADGRIDEDDDDDDDDEGDMDDDDDDSGGDDGNDGDDDDDGDENVEAELRVSSANDREKVRCENAFARLSLPSPTATPKVRRSQILTRPLQNKVRN
jgi:hypothetical protein